MRRIEIGIYYKGDTKEEKVLVNQIAQMMEFASRELEG